MDKNQILQLCLLLGVFGSAVGTDGWSVTVVQHIEALVSSCVVLPCSFTHPHQILSTSNLRGKWLESNDMAKLIYYKDETMVLKNFRGRTKLLGELGEGNCSLEIIDVKDHDNGPFCFRIELARTPTDTSTVDKYSFVKNCVTLSMTRDPPKPKLEYNTPMEGYPFIITCSVLHTCPTHKPNLTWSRGSKNYITERHRKLQLGVWETLSILTFIPKEKDDHKKVTCRAEFNGQVESTETMTLYVKRAVNYNHIIIPSVVAVVTAGIFGGLCIFMVKKYKKRIVELQNQDSTMWNRMSRISRRSNNSVEQKFNKPPVPSPKSQPKSYNYKQDSDDDDYVNTADLNIYGNV